MEHSKFGHCEVKSNKSSDQSGVTAQELKNMKSQDLNCSKFTENAIDSCTENTSKGSIEVNSPKMGSCISQKTSVSTNDFSRLNISSETTKNIMAKDETPSKAYTLSTFPEKYTGPPTMPSNICVHSQIDFMHFLVPDLDRIFNASYYWGKMDRYEAESLLDGKEEGTFLLRDSAQEEFLFSVTFRKYGRSLHARIEQNGQKFSFDCHDPCVYTASTITGLLEHYKDPSCVMFFEPMLTIPCHRPFTFSLQQLCRAKIVSTTTYNGVNQLELPVRLKTYLKEFHFKQKLCVRPFDDF